ncbi:thyrotropin-releasing hormone receptor-like isoform X3 [Lineus longissimus]|uniref:thyrotropin-releasing hormone receptor-like isoform X3 n=1 Tax=Lineus longissimus TaxID=88925 RepID=UPI00315CEB29
MRSPEIRLAPMENDSSSTFSVTRAGDTPSETPDYQFLITFFVFLTQYFWIVPVVLGVPGNVLSIFVANRKHNRALSPCIYMKAMAVADMLVLIQQAIGLPLLYTDIGAQIVYRRDIIHKCHVYIYFTCAMLSGFFLAEMSVDRLIAVRFPMAAPRICTTSRAIKTVIITAIFGIIFNFQLPFVMVYVKDPVSVKSASEKRAKMSEGQGQGNRKEEQHLTRMLIFVSCAYVVSSLPFRLYILLIDIPEIGWIYNMDDTYWNLRYAVQGFFVFDVWLFNYAINFYLYCIGGGVKYRRDAKDVCKELVSC